ncbi:TPA: LOW QUALITY PROTEIN: hypothetical protein N0F65_008867 [Lagenidium giganteum]|uniref:ABC transporter domain-containing protein n=1 Tax=Lagenidium giganteum TaxID=4803 RepID=A0AAV2YKS8_9STRA|nr:TPA: LOW QUALITY PROTEIN: hypothetical protein N0F65_008867 [Lagenidium giganteum]
MAEPPIMEAAAVRQSNLRFIPALLWKNALLKRKRQFATLLEVLMPVIMIILLNFAKSSSSTDHVAAGFSTSNNSINLFADASGNASTPVATKVKQFVQTETSMSGLLLHMAAISGDERFVAIDDATAAKACFSKVRYGGQVSMNTSSPYALPSECGGKVVPFKLAIIPDTTFTRQYFFETIKTWYPTVEIGNGSSTLVVPSVEDSVVFYKSEKELEDYVTSKDYGTVATTPRVFGALVFNKFPTDDSEIGKFGNIEYSVRLNATGVNGNENLAYTPRTKDGDGASTWKAYERSMDNKFNTIYASNGFMTLQTLVARFVNCMPGWDTTTKTASGKCQVAEATAVANDELTNRMTDYLLGDPSMKTAWADMITQGNSLRGLASDAAIPAVTLSTEARTALVRPLLQAPQPYLGASVSPFPVEEFKKSSFYTLIESLFLMVFLFGNMQPLSKIMENLISERETRSRELMKILGVKDSSIVTSWYITYIVMFVVSSVLQTIVAKMGLFAFSSGVLLFLFFFLFSLSLLGFGFMVSSVFSKSRTGVYVGVIAFFLMMSVSNAFSDRSSELSKSIACLLSPVGLAFSIKALAAVETNETGMSFANAGIRVINFQRTGRALSVQRMRKVFPVPGGVKEAVKNVTLNMYEGQITCLLGHNGAGKTTLISMLTGVLGATSGDAYFHGMSVSEDMDEMRQSLGICFQHDVLYPELTVEEHLQFYARIKGYSGDTLQQEVNSKIAEVGLTDKRSVLSSALSGGMKRKLSVAIALLGDSSLVFLDEPTSGMDPYSRRSTWEILMNNRQNRVLVLTTHFMDEADILGDRIAIMAEGELRCCGSPLFLKNRFGAGYNLTIVKKENCNDSRVIDFIVSHIPQAQVLSNLPMDTSSKFAGLFRQLDASLSSLALHSYGISVTTMEEVFIKVAESGDTDQQHTLKKDAKERGDRHASSISEAPEWTSTRRQAMSASTMFISQIKALVQKRFRIGKRDKRMFIMSLVLPMAWLVLGLSTLRASQVTTPDPSIPLNLNALQKEAGSIGLPSFCQTSSGGWCEGVLGNDYFTGGTPSLLSDNVIGNPAYPTDTPTVFGVEYTNPSINKSDSTGYLLKLSEQIFDRTKRDGAKNQFGGYLVHADSTNQVFAYNVLVNTTLPHGSVAFKTMMDQALYRFMAKKADSSVDASGLSLKAINQPLPDAAASKARASSAATYFVSIFVVLAFAYFPAASVVLLVKEKEAQHNSKHQQLVSGVQLSAFWLANFVWDVVVYVVPFAAALALIQGFNVPALTGSKECVTCTSSTFPSVVVLFLLFGFAISPFAYCCSFLFKKQASSQTHTMTINMAAGLGLMILSMILGSLESTKAANKYIQYVFRLSPLFCLGSGLSRLSSLEAFATGSGSSSEKLSSDPFAWENTGREMVFLVLDAVLYLCLAIAMDYAMTFPKMMAKLSKDPTIAQKLEKLDEDVAAEAHRVASGQADDDAIKLAILRKVYPDGNKVAVKALSFGLKKGDCFGFLGINGAGKTTTMKMLTGDIVPTSGNATLAGFDILTQQLEVRREIGMEECEALCTRVGIMVGGGLKCLGSIQHLKGRFGDGLMLDAKLSVASSSEVEQMALHHFDAMNSAILQSELPEKCALLGFPSWEQKIVNTHVTGQTLANQMTRDGYVTAGALVSWCLSETKFEALSQFLHEHFGNVELLERQNDSCWFKLREDPNHQGALRLSNVFDLVETAKASLGIREYSVSQTTLEQIFNAFATCLPRSVPSTGMDPVSRRFMWDVIAEISTHNKESTVVLTTHSMEECEALCTRVGIMVGGGLKCLGSIQHLKGRFGDGLMLDAKLSVASSSEVEQMALRHFDGVNATISQAELSEKCTLLGQPSWEQKIDNTHVTGHTLANQMTRDGYVTAAAFVAWWLSETKFEAFSRFLRDHFGSVELLERQNDSCWFKLRETPNHQGALRLSNVFDLVENAKASLSIREYSVSQTTLEQIFNAFASQQNT